MAITLIGTPQIATAGDGNDVTLVFDGSPVEDDMLLLMGGNGDNNGAGDIGPSTGGYANQALRQTSDESFSEGVWTKFMGATPDTEVIGQGSGVAQEATVYVAYMLRGVDLTTPMDTAVVEFDQGTSPNANCSAIVTVTDLALVVAFGAWGWNAAATGFPSGYTDTESEGALDTRRIGLGTALKLGVTPAGSEDPGNFTGQGNRDTYCMTVAVRPAGGAPAVVLPEVHRIGSRLPTRPKPTGTRFYMPTKFYQQTFLGSDTPVGGLTKKGLVTFEGVDTPTGAAAKKPTVTFEGSDTPTGALTNLKAVLISMAGAIATITGALVKNPLIARGGALTPAGALAGKDPSIIRTGSDTPTGSLSKEAQVTFEGSDTPTGALAVLKTLLQTVTGVISVITGALSLKVLKALAGSDTPVGSLDQEPAVTFEGTITSVGVLTNLKAILLTITGTLTSVGALAKEALLSRGGSVASSGSLNKKPSVTFEGTVTSVGILTALKTILLTVTGTITSAGGLTKKVLKTLTGILTSVGSLATLVITSGAPKVVRAFKAARRIAFSNDVDDDFKGGA